jgi:hypothetical protein
MRNLNQVINDPGLARAEWGSEAAIRLAPALSKSRQPALRQKFGQFNFLLLNRWGLRHKDGGR